MIETIVLGSIWHYVYGTLMTLTAIFLIMLVLVQRGRGGGLAGAFGGMGGQSAFGTKAGDTFTKVTIYVSLFWILLCIASVKFLGSGTGSFGQMTAPDETQVIPRDPLQDAAIPPTDAATPPANPTTTPTDSPTTSAGSMAPGTNGSEVDTP